MLLPRAADETAEKAWTGGRVIAFVVGGVSYMEVRKRISDVCCNEHCGVLRLLP